jgi:hypothetical protein
MSKYLSALEMADQLKYLSFREIDIDSVNAESKILSSDNEESAHFIMDKSIQNSKVPSHYEYEIIVIRRLKTADDK